MKDNKSNYGMELKNNNKSNWSLVAVFIILILLVPFFISCSSNNLSTYPLTEFIYYADENGLPTEYLKLINGKISIKYRARPAYSNSTVYLTDAFDDKGNFMQFYSMDSFEISSVYHESFHAYVDLIIRGGASSKEERESFEQIMAESLSYYDRTADGRKILWNSYRRQSSEEAMAIHITNLIKYRIVYEKIAESIASDYIYDRIDRDQMESKLTAANMEWKDILEGNRSRGYYNKNFLRWKFQHLIDVKNYISDREKEFVIKYILPGIDSEIKEPPLTEFIKESKKNDLPYVYLIDVNKNNLWEDDFTIGPYEELSPEGIAQIYQEAFDVYWKKILIRGVGSKINENKAFSKIMELSSKWYSSSTEDVNKTYQIAKNAAKSYIGELIKQKVLWQRSVSELLLGGESLNKEEFEKSWKKAVEGRNIYGFYLEGGKIFKASNAMSLEEKKFILDFILTDINYSFGPLLSIEPVPAEGEITAESHVDANLLP